MSQTLFYFLKKIGMKTVSYMPYDVVEMFEVPWNCTIKLVRVLPSALAVRLGRYRPSTSVLLLVGSRRYISSLAYDICLRYLPPLYTLHHF